ncbi:hypothetical protein HYH03_003141 [Edaphochlamys debaryana]|uniref:C3H1-type domain-containing protein n=1 Tax=Edaphochlamys debaryana TaxID=47281 RepID=A0A835YDN9_9CHLO|nr:hypothetical protein HYH03_003141 [Edaphochlamys debaryana]|eukprot:KAG2498951.1 hypothetical protein HYH03_003141 [Edaphochlamys debaryana]
MSYPGSQQEPGQAEGPQLVAYNQAAGLISSLAGATAVPQHGIGANNSFSPSLELLTAIPLGPSQSPVQQQHSSPGGLTAGFGGFRSQQAFGNSTSVGKLEAPGEKQLCTFFLRTGTCAYGDRCKFRHPLDRPPPVLNSRGYPVRGEEPDCAHYLKKGWCAFGPTCKFNHPEIQPSILSSYSLTQPPAAFVSLPTTTFPSATVYSVPSALPTLYYLSPGVSPQTQLTSNLLPPNAVNSMAAQQQAQAQQLQAFAMQQQNAAIAAGVAAQAPVYRQQQQAQMAVPQQYGSMASMMGGGMQSGMGGGGMGGGGMQSGIGMVGMGGGGIGGGMGNASVAALQEAFQGLAMSRNAGGLGRGR